MQIFRNRWFIVAVLMLSALSGHSRQVECFVAGTQILMADGSSKNIEDIQPDDLVRSTIPTPGNSRTVRSPP